MPRGELFAYRPQGFWKSVDTNKDQEDLERLYVEGQASWHIDDEEPQMQQEGAGNAGN